MPFTQQVTGAVPLLIGRPFAPPAFSHLPDFNQMWRRAKFNERRVYRYFACCF